MDTPGTCSDIHVHGTNGLSLRALSCENVHLIADGVLLHLRLTHRLTAGLMTDVWTQEPEPPHRLGECLLF